MGTLVYDTVDREDAFHCPSPDMAYEMAVHANEHSSEGRYIVRADAHNIGDAEQLRVVETGARYFRVIGGRHDGRWLPTETTASGFLTPDAVLDLGVIEIVEIS